MRSTVSQVSLVCYRILTLFCFIRSTTGHGPLVTRFPAFFRGWGRLACGVRRVGSGASGARAACRTVLRAQGRAPESCLLVARARPVTCTHRRCSCYAVWRLRLYPVLNSPLKCL